MPEADVAAAWTAHHWRSALRPGEQTTATARQSWVEDGAVLLRALATADVVAAAGTQPHRFDSSCARRVISDVAAVMAPASAPTVLFSPATLPPFVDALMDALAQWCAQLRCTRDCVRAGCSITVLTACAAQLPSLVRLMAMRLRYWSEALAELGQRIEGDRALLEEEFGVHGDVADLVFPAGDEHHRGRATALVHFTSGVSVAYKPRAQSLIIRLGKIAAELKARQPKLSVSFPPATDMGTYGWAAFVEPIAEPDKPRTVHYRRLGQAAALTWALAGRDIHLGNIVLSDAALHIIDEEVFGLGVVSDNPSLPAALREELRFFEASPVHTGIFPYRTPLPGRDHGVDFSPYSGLRTALATQTPVPASTAPLLDADSLAFLDGYDEMLSAFGDTVEDSEAFRQQVRGLAFETCRLVPLPTARYSELLTQSLRPDLLVSGTAREEFFEAELRANSAFKPWRAVLIPDEVDDLFNGDVPLFHGPVNSRSVQGSTGHHHELLDHTGEDVLLHRMMHLPAERASLRWQATAALECATRNRRPQNHQPDPCTQPDQRHGGPSLLLDAAQALLSRVHGLAVQTMDGGLAWADTRHDPRRLWYIGHCGTSIRSGTSGILLAATLLQSPFTPTALSTTAGELSERLLEPWLRELEQLSQTEGIYALGELCERLPVAVELLQHRPDERVHTAVEMMLSSIQQSIPHLDRHTGIDISPALLALLGSSPLLPTPYQEAAEHACQDLLSRQTHQPQSYDATLALLLAARRFDYSPFGNAHAVPPGPHSGTGSAYFSSWTDGRFVSLAAQVLICNANGTDEPGGELRFARVTEAIRTSPAHGRGLAQGTAGRIGALSLIGDHMEAATAATQLALDVLDGSNRSTTGNSGSERPGLLSGMAGTAYELARCASGNRMPSLLLPARLAESEAWTKHHQPRTEETHR